MKVVLVLLVLLPALAAFATTYTVAPPTTQTSGGDGSRERPWTDLQAALDALQPGDVLEFRGGVYPVRDRLIMNRSGEPGAWITLRAAEGETPILDAVTSIPTDFRDSVDKGILSIAGPSRIRLEGLTFVNSYRFGLYIGRPSTHIDVVRCRVRRTFGPAIGVWNAAQIRVLGCEVSEANTQLMRLYGDKARECPHEAISIAGVDGFEVAYNHVHHCEKEGIDVKEVSRNGKVHHNYVHDLRRQGLYCDAWFGLLENVEFYANTVHHCEWGIAFSVEGSGSEMRNVQAHHNLIFEIRASGVYFGTWGGDGPRSGIRIYNNTINETGRIDHWAGATGGIDLRSRNSRDIVVANNIIGWGAAYQIATPIAPSDRSLFAERGLVIAANHSQELRDITTGFEGYGRMFGLLGADATTGDPRFVAPESGDFRLAAESPAIRVGARGLPGIPEFAYIGAYGEGMNPDLVPVKPFEVPILPKALAEHRTD